VTGPEVIVNGQTVGYGLEGMAAAYQEMIGVCLACRSTVPPIVVHGHLQCAECHTVLSTCCEGDCCGP
jgi:hypothetical protein